MVAAAMRLHGKAIPEANLHLDKKGDAMASAIVAVFQKPGKGGQACAALPAPLLPGPGKEWKQREMQMQQRPATHSEQRAPGSAKGSVTLVAIGYDVTRAQNLTEIITKYLAMEIVAAVILIWNNLAVPVPKRYLYSIVLTCAAPSLSHSLFFSPFLPFYPPYILLLSSSLCYAMRTESLFLFPPPPHLHLPTRTHSSSVYWLCKESRCALPSSSLL